MVEGLKERDKEKLLIIGLGAFYIAIGEDAVLLHEELGLKCTCFKNHICKVGIPRNSIGKYIKEIEKLKYGYILYDYNSKNKRLLELSYKEGKKNKIMNKNINCLACMGASKYEEDDYSIALLKFIEELKRRKGIE
jgi:MutS domain I protein